MEHTWLSSQQAAGRLGVNLRTLYKLIDTDGLPAYQLGRHIRLQVREVDAYIESKHIRPGSLAHLYPSEVERDED